MSAEYTFGAFGPNGRANGTLTTSNTSDTYHFSLSSTQNLAIALGGLSNDADVRLFRGSSINGQIEAIAEIARSEKTSNQNELISQTLNPGNYIIEVYRFSGSTNYTLNLSTDNPRNTFDVGTLNGAQTFSGSVNTTNSSDLYRFSLNTTSNLGATLTGLSQDADLIIARDFNRNGAIDSGEEIGRSNRSSNFNEQLNLSSLVAGDYLANVAQFGNSSTHYRLGLTNNAVNNLSSTTDLTGQRSIDLTGQFRTLQAPDIRQTDQRGQAEVVVTNQGPGIANRRVTVNLYASTNQTYDSNDELIGSQTIDLSLARNQSQTYQFLYGNPTNIAPGSYYTLARIDSNNAIAETNEGNNLAIRHVSAPGTDVVLDWNATLLNAIQAEGTAPPLAARNQAIVHAAIYDAVNAIDRQHTSFQVNIGDASLTRGASIVAAAAQAAYQTLVELFPNQRSEFDAQLARSLAEVPDGAAETRGIDIGRFVADQILSARATDGSAQAQAPYTPGNRPGDYQFTHANGTALLPAWGNVRPFAIPNAARFVPDGPPIYGSTAYANELNAVQRLGGSNSTARTNDQTEIAVFWAYDRADTFRPPAQWNQIAEVIALEEGTSIVDNARLFAAINVAQADAGIAAWLTKYTHNQLRPITAIHQANADGNAQTIGDPNWQSFLPTPPFPDYISGHSTFGAAAAGVLSAFFGNNYEFSASSQEISGTYRTFRSFQEAAAENGISRIYGGVHVASANQDGLDTGYAVANYVTRNFFS